MGRPVKGASTRLDGRYRRSVIDRTGSRADGQALYLVDTNHYKDALFARMHRDEEEGGWYVDDGCDPEYCEMVTSEHKVVRKYGGRLVSVWEPKAQGRPNHYWDCEVYAALAADLCGLRGINAAQARERQELPAPAEGSFTAPSRLSAGIWGQGGRAVAGAKEGESAVMTLEDYRGQLAEVQPGDHGDFDRRAGIQDRHPQRPAGRPGHPVRGAGAAGGDHRVGRVRDDGRRGAPAGLMGG